MKDESPSRDTRLDPLDVVPDPTTPGGVLLPPDKTEVAATPPVVPARPSAPPARPTRPPPGLPSATGRVPPRAPQLPQPFGAGSTQKLGGFAATPSGAAYRA